MSPSTFTKSPKPFLRFSKIVDFCTPSDCGIFHVTTQGDVLDKQGRLKSRDELALDEESTTGLAGGPSDVVSTTISLSRAMTLWGAMRSLSRCVHGDVTYSELLAEFFQWTGFPDSQMWSRFFAQDSVDLGKTMTRLASNLFSNDTFDSFRMCDAESFVTQESWVRFVYDESRELDLVDGQDAYRNIQFGENYLASLNVPREHGKADNDVCSPIIGFASSYQEFARVSPDQISVVQLSANINSKPVIVARECEIRFAPKDTKIVRRRVEERGMIKVLP